MEVARELAPGLVLVLVLATLDAPVGPLPGVHDARFTFVATAQAGRWQITAFHNTLVGDTH